MGNAGVRASVAAAAAVDDDGEAVGVGVGGAGAGWRAAIVAGGDCSGRSG